MPAFLALVEYIVLHYGIRIYSYAVMQPGYAGCDSIANTDWTKPEELLMHNPNNADKCEPNKCAKPLHSSP